MTINFITHTHTRPRSDNTSNRVYMSRASERAGRRKRSERQSKFPFLLKFISPCQLPPRSEKKRIQWCFKWTVPGRVSSSASELATSLLWRARRSSEKKKMSSCQKQRQQIIRSITHTSTFNVRKKQREREIFGAKKTNVNEAFSLYQIWFIMQQGHFFFFFSSCWCPLNIDVNIIYPRALLFILFLACVQFGRANSSLPLSLSTYSNGRRNERCVFAWA